MKRTLGEFPHVCPKPVLFKNRRFSSQENGRRETEERFVSHLAEVRVGADHGCRSPFPQRERGVEIFQQRRGLRHTIKREGDVLRAANLVFVRERLQ